MSETTTPARQRANESWWREHGGEEWQVELDRRRPTQAHYAQQEAFFTAFFRGASPARVLDYGCGYGRHERYLKNLPGIEIYGCDISPKMLKHAAQYIGDPAFAETHLKLIECGQPLPFPDKFFDVAFTSEVLIHVAPDDLPPILSELRRVAKRLVLHVENVRVVGSRRENDEHEGCWLHDLPATWESIGGHVRVVSGAIERQDVYILPLEDRQALDATTAAANNLAAAFPATPREAVDADILLDNYNRAESLHVDLEKLSHAFEAQSERCLYLESAVNEFQSSTAFKLATRAHGLPLFDVARRAAKTMVRLADQGAGMLAGGASQPEPAAVEPETEADRKPDALAFGGVATRASEASPEAFIARRPRAICICHPEWRGIRAATYGQGEAVLEVPGIVNGEHQGRLIDFIGETGARKVVVNGVPPGFVSFARALKRRQPAVQVMFVFHGSTAQHVTAPDEARMLDELFVLAQAGVVSRIGFVKQGLAEYFRTLGAPAAHVMNFVQARPDGTASAVGPDGRVHVGVFVPNLWHKNINTQIAAASMIPGATVHVTELPPSPYLERSKAKFVEHGLLDHHEFTAVLGQMQANLYVSLTECYPMTVLESIARGVPCVTSHTSALFDDDPALFRDLVVTRHDNPAAIAERLLDVLARRDEILPRARAHLDKLNAQARQRWEEFLAE